MHIMLAVLALCFPIVIGSEPSCPDSNYQQHMMEHVVESKLLLKEIGDDVGKMVDKLGHTNDDRHFKLMERKIENMTDSMKAMDLRIDSLQKTIREGMTKPSHKPSQSAVAFTMILAARRVRQSSLNTIIKFDKTVHNKGGHFNTETGLFTAPVDGVYVFHGSIMADNDAEVWGYIKTKDVSANLYARASGSRHDQGSQSLTIALNARDIVSMHGGPDLYGEAYTMFSGFLLYKL